MSHIVSLGLVACVDTAGLVLFFHIRVNSLAVSSVFLFSLLQLTAVCESIMMHMWEVLVGSRFSTIAQFRKLTQENKSTIVKSTITRKINHHNQSMMKFVLKIR